MLETMEKSSGNVLGYKVSGDVTKADYATLDPAVGAAIKEYGSVCLLFDLKDFSWEKVDAWASDLEARATSLNVTDRTVLEPNPVPVRTASRSIPGSELE